jgi:hypothetical protein
MKTTNKTDDRLYLLPPLLSFCHAWLLAFVLIIFNWDERKLISSFVFELDEYLLMATWLITVIFMVVIWLCLEEAVRIHQFCELDDGVIHFFG